LGGCTSLCWSGSYRFVMAAKSPSDQLQITVLAVLIGAASASLLVVFLAPTPLPPPLPTGSNALEIPGYRLQPIKGEAPAAGRRLSRSALLRFVVQPSPSTGAPPLEMVLVNVHSRSHNTFQLASLTSGADAPAGMALKQRRLLPGVPPVALGLIPGSAKNTSQLALQTCLAAQSTGNPADTQPLGGVTQKQLTGLLYPQTVGGQGLQGLWRDGAQLLGLESNVRWQCLLIHVSTTQIGHAGEKSLIRFFNSASHALKSMMPTE
jgi:hypothetical protein